MAVLVSAFAGAMAVTALIFFFSLIIRNSVMLLIIGIMVGYMSSSVVSLLNFFATEEGVKKLYDMGYGQFWRSVYGAYPNVYGYCKYWYFLFATTDETAQCLATWCTICREFRF